MSTRSVIARPVDGVELDFRGRYVHSDGYPSGVGQTLFVALREQFNGDLGAMLKLIIDDHPAGWSSLMNADFSLKPGFTSYDVPKKFKRPNGTTDWERYLQSPQWRRPRCYCHGQRRWGDEPRTRANVLDSDIEYLYLIHEPARVMTILMPREDSFTHLTEIDLDGEAPDWKALDQRAREWQHEWWTSAA